MRLAPLNTVAVLAMTSIGVPASAQLVMTCIPGPVQFPGNSAPSVVFECRISNMGESEILIGGTQIDFPCTINGEAGAGSLTMQQIQVLRNNTDPPFLFGPDGLAPINATACRVAAAPSTKTPDEPAVLPPGESRYLATARYRASDCAAGQFTLTAENVNNPPPNDLTRVTIALTRIPFTWVSSMIEIPTGACCRGPECIGELNQFCCLNTNEGSSFNADETCASGSACVPNNCPPADLIEVFPISGTVDARQPHPTGDDSTPALTGIGSIAEPIEIVLTANGADPGCFSLCESVENPELGANGVASSLEDNGAYSLTLSRPITPGAVTVLYYDGVEVANFEAHPANTDAGAMSDANDVLSLNGYLLGDASPFGLYSNDINHSGAADLMDIPAAINLLTGADLHDAWAGTSRPVDTCP